MVKIRCLLTNQNYWSDQNTNKNKSPTIIQLYCRMCNYRLNILGCSYNFCNVIFVFSSLHNRKKNVPLMVEILNCKDFAKSDYSQNA